MDSRGRWFAALFLVTLGAPGVFAACDRCQRPQVVQFDLRVVPSRPSDTSDHDLANKIQAWRNLFWTSAGVKGYLFDEDPSRECYTHLDGAFYTQGDTAGHSLKFGEEWSNLPSASGGSGGDYLVTGSVEGADGSYTAKVELQVSKTREVVISGTRPFTSAQEPITAGRLAASTLAPLLDKIRAFEKSKRATGDPYALAPTAELHPAKTNLKEGESVEVEVWLYDCDGDISSSPLANRPVQLSATNGTLSETSVTTGSDGKAKVTFKAGTKPAEALLTAVYPYTLASEHTSASEPGYASLQIEAVPTSLWKLQGTLITLRTYEETSSSSYAQITEGGRSNQDIAETFRVSGVLRNEAKDSTTLFQSEPKPVDLRLEGTHRETELARGFLQSPQFWSRRQTFATVFSRPGPSSTSMGSFQYALEPDGSGRRRGDFSLWGIPVLGDAQTTGTDCNSSEGCKPVSVNDEVSDEIDFSVVVQPDSTENDRDTSYTDDAGIQIQAQLHQSIRSQGGAFLIDYLEYERRVQLGTGTVAKVSYTSTLDRRGSFVLSPIDGKTSSLHQPPAFLAKPRGLASRVALGKLSWTVSFEAPQAGILSARLMDLDGKILSVESRSVHPGTGRLSFPVPISIHRMVVSEVAFTAPDGKVTRTVRRHLPPSAGMR